MRGGEGIEGKCVNEKGRRLVAPTRGDTLNQPPR